MPAGGRPHVAFAQSRTIHFARFAILTDPDRGPDAARLLYASVYDGTLEAHAAELAALSSDFDAIWGKLEGYTGRDDFARLLAGARARTGGLLHRFPRRNGVVDPVGRSPLGKRAMPP